MPVRTEQWSTGTPCWVDLQVDDVDAARRFYGSLFGWEAADPAAAPGGHVVAMLGPRAVAGLGPTPPGGQVPRGWMSHFAVDDVDAAAARVREAGGRIVAEPFDVPGAGRMAVAADNVGAVFGLWQARGAIGAELFGEPGSWTWNELHTKDFAASTRFYGQVFGYTYEKLSDTDEMRYWLFVPPGAEEGSGGIYEDRELPADAPGDWLAWFAVEDVDATLSAAEGLGASATMPATDSPYGRMAVLAGAQGERFGILVPTPPPADEEE